MPKARGLPTGIKPSEGSRVIFDDGDHDLAMQIPLPSSSRPSSPLEEGDNEDEGSEDEAPEAVGIDQVKDNETEETERGKQYVSFLERS